MWCVAVCDVHRSVCGVCFSSAQTEGKRASTAGVFLKFSPFSLAKTWRFLVSIKFQHLSCKRQDGHDWLTYVHQALASST